MRTTAVCTHEYNLALQSSLYNYPTQIKFMKLSVLLLLYILRALVEIHSQTEYPYLEFRGERLPNHGYVNLASVGTNASNPGNTVRCYTNLHICCSSTQGNHRGDWYFPNEQRLGFSADSSSPNIYEVRRQQRVDMARRNNAFIPSGIYRCDIPTNNDDISMKEVYLGVYNRGGKLMSPQKIISSYDSMYKVKLKHVYTILYLCDIII